MLFNDEFLQMIFISLDNAHAGLTQGNKKNTAPLNFW